MPQLEAQPVWVAVAGGLMIGLASLWAHRLSGKVPGISGVTARILKAPSGDTVWRVFFIAGLVVGGGLCIWLLPDRASFTYPHPTWLLIPAGLLVGFGSRLGGGCTSGHGVCGMGRGSRRSLVATCTFMAVAALSLFVLQRLGA